MTPQEIILALQQGDLSPADARTLYRQATGGDIAALFPDWFVTGEQFPMDPTEPQGRAALLRQIRAAAPGGPAMGDAGARAAAILRQVRPTRGQVWEGDIPPAPRYAPVTAEGEIPPVPGRAAPPLGFASEVDRALAERGMTRADLAQRPVYPGQRPSFGTGPQAGMAPPTGPGKSTAAAPADEPNRMPPELRQALAAALRPRASTPRRTTPAATGMPSDEPMDGQAAEEEPASARKLSGPGYDIELDPEVLGTAQQRVSEDAADQGAPTWALPLIMAGFTMAASRSPDMLTAMAEGGIAGVNQYARDLAEKRRDALTKIAMDREERMAQATVAKTILDAQREARQERRDVAKSEKEMQELELKLRLFPLEQQKMMAAIGALNRQGTGAGRAPTSFEEFAKLVETVGLEKAQQLWSIYRPRTLGFMDIPGMAEQLGMGGTTAAPPGIDPTAPFLGP